jgi:hypothetical protein
MAEIKCPSCGSAVGVPAKKSATPWVIGCLVAVLAIPVLVAVIGLVAAIAIPSFIKARNTAQMNGCVNNMRMIDAGKEQWALSAKAVGGSAVDEVGVQKFLPSNVTPVCPSQGAYTYHDVGTDPECSIHGLLSNPQGQQSQSYE